MARRSKIAIAWSFLIKPLLRFSFLILFLLCFVTGQASSSALFYCQIGQSSKKLPEDKFRFQIKGNEIHFLPLGFFNPGEIFYINENGLFFLARAGRVGATSMGEIEFYPGNSFSGRQLYLQVLMRENHELHLQGEGDLTQWDIMAEHGDAWQKLPWARQEHLQDLAASQRAEKKRKLALQGEELENRLDLLQAKQAAKREKVECLCHSSCVMAAMGP